MNEEANKIERTFETPLGIIRCGLISQAVPRLVETKKYKNGNSDIYETLGYRIELVSFKLKVPLYNGDTLTDSAGWIFRIEKTNDSGEELETYCLVDKANDEVELFPNTGEHLDAIQAENKDWTLNIGTEDGAIMNARAENDDWYPSRLTDRVSFYRHQPITDLKENGVITKVPDLQKGERLHLQYLTAYDKRDDEKVNTWLAVEQFKRELEEWIGF